MGKRRHPEQPIIDARKCPEHNAWKKKGVCELCRLRLDEIQKQNELTGGSYKPDVKIGKL